MLATLALSITTSAALALSLTRNTSLASLTPINITSSVLEQPSALENSVRYRRWPKIPYFIRLRGLDYYTGVYLCIATVEPLRTLRNIDVHDLQLFLRDFAENLRQEYPVPGFMPRDAKQYHIDVASNTKWTYFMSEVFHGRVPTAVALAALDTLDKEMGMYEMAQISFNLKTAGARTLWCLGGFYAEKLVGASFNDSLSNENDSLQTA